ncbi:MAG: hypothetical protein JRI68_32150, partial [Deltaproteobacteria bacterium]|nr:hypothetical protein [Deltaproteobacteria bacterium]
AEDAGEAAWDAFKDGWKDEDKDLGDAVSDGVKDGWESLGEGLDDGIEGLKGKVGDIGTELKGLIPTEDKINGYLKGLESDFSKVLPTEATLKDGATAALSEMTGGMSDSLMAGNYDLALSQAIDMFCTGGISRDVDYVTLKMVGGAYVIASVAKVEWTVGQLYAETIGGVKLTVSTQNINQSVDGLHTVTVGGAMMLAAGASINISAATSAVSVGAAASIKSDNLVSIDSAEVSLTGGGGLLAEGGGAKATLSPGSISFTGILALEAGGSIIIKGGSVDIT